MAQGENECSFGMDTITGARKGVWGCREIGDR
jgi:hypothetical protein